jgi:hypothetical protein
MTGKIKKNLKGNKKKTERRERDEDKKFDEFENAKPTQLSLFELKPNEEQYSHSIELYDFMPKYVWGKSERINGKFLDNIKRKFECRGKRYSLTLMPARIEDDGEQGFKEFYPSKREELLEDALRKLMGEGQGLMLDGEAGIVFTLYQLQKELKESGHTYSYDQLKESLEILKKIDIEIKTDDGETQFFFSPIETLGLKGSGNETQTFVRFSPLVTHSINSFSYRLINYDKVMSYKSVIARQFHKRMSHHFIQASISQYYEILLTTVIRDFGLTPQKRLQQNLTEVENAIEEMKEKNVILNCKFEKLFEKKPRKKLIDVKIKIQPHFDFIADVKRANAKAKKIRGLIE